MISPTGEIAGTIANVTQLQWHSVRAWQGSDKHAARTAAIDAAGSFHFLDLPPGDYTVEVFGVPEQRVSVVAHRRAGVGFVIPRP